MKKFTKIKIIFTIILFASLTISCNEEVPELNNSINNVDLTTIGILKGNPMFTQLVKAIEITELTETLKNNQSYTLFAPSNEAFDAFLKSTTYKSINEVPKETLKQILLYHVLKDQVEAKDFTTGTKETLATNGGSEVSYLTININVSSGITLNNGVKVLSADYRTIEILPLKGSNGIIFIVDKVISLPSSSS